MGDSAVLLQNVTKRYGAFTAVNDLSFDVKPGEIYGFLGPNGAGKTHDFAHDARHHSAERRFDRKYWDRDRR